MNYFIFRKVLLTFSQLRWANLQSKLSRWMQLIGQSWTLLTAHYIICFPKKLQYTVSTTFRRYDHSLIEKNNSTIGTGFITMVQGRRNRPAGCRTNNLTNASNLQNIIRSLDLLTSSKFDIIHADEVTVNWFQTIFPSTRLNWGIGLVSHCQQLPARRVLGCSDVFLQWRSRQLSTQLAAYQTPLRGFLRIRVSPPFLSICLTAWEACPCRQLRSLFSVKLCSWKTRNTKLLTILFTIILLVEVKPSIVN